MKKLSIIMPIVAFAAISTFAADGIRYKDRLFEVSKANTVTVAEDVPFLDSDDHKGDETGNYNALSMMIIAAQLLRMDVSMMYFYNQEIFKKSPLLMDIYEPRVSESEPDPEKNVRLSLFRMEGRLSLGVKTILIKNRLPIQILWRQGAL